MCITVLCYCFFLLHLRYADKYTIFGRHRLTSGEVALDRSEQKGLSVIANPLVKMAHSEFCDRWIISYLV